jgi:hypothetical protein
MHHVNLSILKTWKSCEQIFNKHAVHDKENKSPLERPVKVSLPTNQYN